MTTFDEMADYVAGLICDDDRLSQFCHEVACAELGVPRHTIFGDMPEYITTGELGGRIFEDDPRCTRYYEHLTAASIKVVLKALASLRRFPKAEFADPPMYHPVANRQFTLEDQVDLDPRPEDWWHKDHRHP